MNILNYRFYLVVMFTFALIALNSTAIATFLYQHHLMDKAGHLVGFFFLSWLIDKVISIDLKVTIFILCVYAGLTELGQSYLGFRNGEVSDFIADVLGCLIYALVITVSQYKAKKEMV